MCEALPPTLKKKTKTERREHKTHFFSENRGNNTRHRGLYASILLLFSGAVGGNFY